MTIDGELLAVDQARPQSKTTRITYIQNSKRKTKHRPAIHIGLVSLAVGPRHASREAHTTKSTGVSALTCGPSGPTAYHRQIPSPWWRVWSASRRRKCLMENDVENGQKKRKLRASMTTIRRLLSIPVFSTLFRLTRGIQHVVDLLGNRFGVMGHRRR